ncbi:AraC-type DNA-binding domain-containing protein [Longilinea arvoryzae]|uniref:AraC-type DNA-binding domain-containing protein n=1 Tax=Longilinea arvoryzae TaxID=360412 RepID=A0A0S7BHE0_9CHLR|nr:GyrI-like domain-containing protein [Longilinea arvoryzae]GAP14019.1 AraC-type DNA-binding domain-containing protein [Longilinea arvoryzae]
MDSNRIYQKRINLAIDYISTHISEPISLDTLSGISGFSSFYFHRIFTALVGETPADYVLRTRLEMAQNYLIKTSRSVTQIALESGFTNSAIFARTFRQRYGITPSQYRAGIPVKDQPAHPNLLTDPPEHSYVIHEVSLKNMPDIYTIYVSCYEGYDMRMICRAWEKLNRWAVMQNLDLSGSQAIGISLDDPLITRQNKCRYYACLSTPTEVRASPPVNNLTIPGGRYAVYHTESPAAELRQVYYAIFHDWLPDTGFQPANSLPFEVYLQTPEGHPRQWFDVNICIPVQPIPI